MPPVKDRSGSAAGSDRLGDSAADCPNQGPALSGL
jgi:hypothetical protein